MSDRDTTTPTVEAMCTEPPAAPVPAFVGLFPPRDADEQTYRRWLAESPWPEVVFAAAR